MVTIGDILYANENDYYLEINVTQFSGKKHTAYLFADFIEKSFKLVKLTGVDKEFINVCDCSDLIRDFPLVIVPNRDNHEYDKICHQPVRSIFNRLVDGMQRIYSDFNLMQYGFDKRLIAMAKRMYLFGSVDSNDSECNEIMCTIDMKTHYRILRVGGNFHADVTVNDKDTLVTTQIDNSLMSTRFFIEEYPYCDIYFDNQITNGGTASSGIDYSDYYIRILHSRSNFEIGRVYALSPHSRKLALTALFPKTPLVYNGALYREFTVQSGLSVITNSFKYEPFRSDAACHFENILEYLQRDLVRKICRVIYNMDETGCFNNVRRSQSISSLICYAVDSFINSMIDHNFNGVPDDILPQYRNFIEGWIYNVRNFRMNSGHTEFWRLKHLSTKCKKFFLHFGGIHDNYIFGDKRIVSCEEKNALFCVELPIHWQSAGSPMKYALNMLLRKFDDDFPVQLIVGEGNTNLSIRTLPFPAIRFHEGSGYAIIREYTIKEFLDSISLIDDDYQFADPVNASLSERPIFLLKDSFGVIATYNVDMFKGWDGDKESVDHIDNLQIGPTGHITDCEKILRNTGFVETVFVTENRSFDNVFTFSAVTISGGFNKPVHIGDVYIPAGRDNAVAMASELSKKYRGKPYRDIIDNECASPADIIIKFCKEIVSSIITEPGNYAKHIRDDYGIIIDVINIKVEIKYYFIIVDDMKFMQTLNSSIESTWVYDNLTTCDMSYYFEYEFYGDVDISVNVNSKKIQPIIPSKNIMVTDSLNDYRYIVINTSKIPYPIIIGYSVDDDRQDFRSENIVESEEG